MGTTLSLLFYVINSKTFVSNLGARYETSHDLKRINKRQNAPELVNVHRFRFLSDSPSGRDLQDFLAFSQHPAWVITPVNPQKVWSTAFIT